MIKKINFKRIGLLSSIPVLAIVTSLASIGIANAAITSTLDLGASGSQVTELQQFLATDVNIYPSGLVTGYFGPLTQAGVKRFQAAQGIVSSGSPSTTGYGRVGPSTMARINSLLGVGNQYSWDPAPSLSNPVIQVTNSSVTISWTTNEATIGEVFYSATPLQSDEATGPHQKPYVSGTRVTENGGYQITHMVNIQGLQSGTTYYFLTRGVDSGDNLSMTWPSSFRTN